MMVPVDAEISLHLATYQPLKAPFAVPYAIREAADPAGQMLDRMLACKRSV
jgi:hypothetical protein